MNKRWGIFSLIIVAGATLAGNAQSAKVGAGADDYSKEAAVVEEMSTQVLFENSGNSVREQTSRVRINTDAGVQQWGVLNFPYQSATQTVEIDYVRVRKADGSVVVTPPDNIQDMDSEVTRSAPFYSDLREKHVAVKALSAGDFLEYSAHWNTIKPLAPGQFWFQYDFESKGVVLDERLEIKVPAGRAVKFKGPQATQTITTEGPWRVYSWSSSRLQNSEETENAEKRQTEAERGRFPPPAVEISSFQSWEEVGQWYWNLQKERVEPSPAIRAKAAEITKGLTDDSTKLEAVYAFVSTHYRYIGIAFGIGRYQPHAADDVLTNNFGDCKDKHTLLAALLQAVGITVYPALINSTRQLDADVPSPAQFDHAIGYLPNDKPPMWLDTTPEVAPSGLLLPQLRDKPALVISAENSAKLVTTPIDPPIPGTTTFKITGKLHEDGTFEAQVEDTIRGENEILLRAAFRSVGQPEWKDLAQQISYSLGYSGTVSNVSVSAPEAFDVPFHFSYSYNRKDYPDWSNHQFTVPGLPFLMPSIHDDTKDPVWLGSPLETVSESEMEIPKAYRPEIPLEVNLDYDFAEYHAAYSIEHGVLLAKRRLLIKLHEVPLTELNQYRTFLRIMQNDVNQYVQTSSSTTTPIIPNGPNSNVLASSFMSDIRNLPGSTSPEANSLEEDAREKIKNFDMAGAVSSLYRAVSTDPKFTRAWVLLGTELLMQKQVSAGMDAFHKAMATDPDQAAIPKALGFGLMRTAQLADAVPVWQDYIKSHPDDVDGPANLGNCLLMLNRYPEAASAYEAAVKIKPDQANLQMSLGSAYLLAGDRDKAGSAFQKLPEVDKDGKYFNDAAYQMANADLQLPLALGYAQKAVDAVEQDSQKTTLNDLSVADLGRTIELASYWDTLGWVNERMSNLEMAERYLQSAWKLSQDGVVAGHLCHLYRREHRTESAIQMCRIAISRITTSRRFGTLPEYQTELAAAQENLNFLTHRPKNSKTSIDPSGLSNVQPIIKLPRFLSGTESAEFFVLMAADAKSKTFQVENEKFISGSERMKLQGKQLKGIDFHFSAPSNLPTRFVWRGILGCYQYSGCSFAVLDPASVHSVN